MTGSDISSTHPPLLQTMDNAAFHSLRLLRSRRVGPATYHRLIREHGSAVAALDTLPDIAAAAGVADYKICPEGVIAAEMKAGRTNNARLLVAGQANYPKALLDLPDAPPILWAIGDLDYLKRPMISLVGARNASSLGTRMAKKLAADLGDAGFVVVSGLARGIDTAAHMAALKTGTIAVFGGGVDVIYPSQNVGLAQDVAKYGLRLSEMAMGVQPQARHFPARNALDQSRDVFAVPGHPFDARSAGCNMLIRDGALLVRGADDVIEAVGDIAPVETPAVAQNAPRPLREIANLHSTILERMGPSPVAEDQLIRDIGAAPTAVAPVLVSLELDGRITRQRGGFWR